MKKDIFEVTENHIKLINRMYVEWCSDAYDGAPAINIKRPYGNSGVAYDVYEIINGKEFGSSVDDYMDDDLTEEMLKIHRETETVLQIVLCTKSFVPGIYEKKNVWDSLSWHLVKQVCKHKNENGVCELHNLQCAYPDCEKAR